MAVNLLQASLDQRTDPIEHALVMMFDEYAPIVEHATAVSTDELWDDYERATLLPTLEWRPLNRGVTESTGQTQLYREYLKILTGEVKIDVELVRGPRGRRTVEKQTRLKVQAASNELSRAILEGSELNSAHEMVGLRSRISGNQLIRQASGGGTLTLDAISQLVHAVPFSNKKRLGSKTRSVRKMLYMSRDQRDKMDSLISAQTGSKRINVSLDEFGRQVEMWDDAEICVLEEAGTGNTLLGYDEDPGDGTADTSSMYCVAWGESTAFLLYRGPSNDGAPGNGKILKVFRRDEMETEPRMLLRFSGMFGLEILEPRAAARLYAITDS